jgi:uncharacterized protein YbjT (DUF2867 family)
VLTLQLPQHSISKRILVIGATGNIGQAVVRCLSNFQKQDSKQDGKQDSSKYVVVAACRDPSSGPARALAALPFVALKQVDILEPANVVAACQGVDAVFLCLPQAFAPAQMVEAQRLLSVAMVECGVPRLVKISSYNRGPQGVLGRAHTSGEALFQARSDVITDITLLCPTSFNTNFVAYNVASIKENGSFSSPLGLTARVNWVDVRDIGYSACVCTCLCVFVCVRVCVCVCTQCISFSSTCIRTSVYVGVSEYIMVLYLAWVHYLSTLTMSCVSASGELREYTPHTLMYFSERRRLSCSRRETPQRPRSFRHTSKTSKLKV